ncbi:GAF domain-containing protein [Actinotalea sp. K2]|uniref:GAF domain-containing protein n=1 Tax=Actinotalea sp. K2 TaxID=2939438 RepID=UPI0020177720|nr:GAF domain-containing protein [Actinotalea sp. K2]MCL3863192.1 GAF domain-containing protein [Actinotalea sp. K2]
MTTSPWLAWPSGSDPTELASRLHRAHESFLAGGSAGAVRRIVLESWERSRRSGVDPEHPQIGLDLDSPDLAAYRRDHALAPLMPIVRRILIDGAGSDGVVVGVADDAGRLLWVEGDRAVLRAVEDAGFVEGARWLEQDVGTSAPGIALATDHEVQVFAAEHFSRAVQPWSCSAAPVHDPVSGALLGVLDITGGDAAASPHMLSLARATVAAMEAELAVRALRDAAHARRPVRRRAVTRARPRPAAAPAPRLEVLGRSAGALHAAAEGRGSTTLALGLRHSEMLLLLATHPAGLSADGLAVELHPGTLSDVTVRAEISRLRRAVGPLLGASRPYRLATPLRTDVDDVREDLARGDVAAAVSRYAGPVLPRSQAPGVVALRHEVDAEVRAAVEDTDDVAAVVAWTLSAAGAEDWSAWQRLTALMPAGSPGAARARARLRLLDRTLGGVTD